MIGMNYKAVNNLVNALEVPSIKTTANILSAEVFKKFLTI
ncbi:hypothetical protein ACIN5111_1224 [Acinetobacter baumannii OIFC111]|nr:hypothetical protein ACIN5111_1224 [Acinetobacter baumannii OIFC111]